MDEAVNQTPPYGDLRDFDPVLGAGEPDWAACPVCSGEDPADCDACEGSGVVAVTYGDVPSAADEPESEPDVNEPRPHPAKFSPAIIDAIADIIVRYFPDGQHLKILDPFAGVGGIHVLRDLFSDVETWGVELEPEWANQSPFTVVGDARNLQQFHELGPWDAIITSPAYGNRMADNYDGRDGSTRHTYRIDLGRELTANNGASMHWGDKYRILHSEVWGECSGLIRSGGLAIINAKNFLKTLKTGEDAVEQLVVEWHLASWLNLGYKLEEVVKVPTPGMRHGANGAARIDHEVLLVLRAP